MNVELKQLRYFLAVAEELHFGHAAHRLQIAQPGLSKQIKRLEETIGAELFVRDKRQIELTKAGEVLVEHARLVLGVAERALENTRAAIDGREGLVKISGGGFALNVFPVMTDVLREYETRFPNVRVEFQATYGIPSLAALFRRMIDVAIMFMPFDAPGDVRFQAMGAVEPLIALPSGHRLTAFDRIPPDELRKEVLITWPRPAHAPRFFNHVFATIFGETLPERIVQVADRIEILMRAASGEGVALVAPAVAGLGVANLEFRPVDVPTAVFEYGLVWVETGISPYAAQFIDLARELSEQTEQR